MKRCMCLLLPPFFLFSYLESADDDAMFHGYLHSTLDRVLDKSPVEVRQIVDTLNGVSGHNPYRERYAIFEGEPGSGKSTLAVAIAYATGRSAQIHSAADFLSGSRNDGARLLKESFSDARSSRGKKIFVIEEVNRLLHHYDSEHHDTDSTSMCLWTQLDDLKRKDKHKKIFFIGTMNGLGGLPPQIQSRWEDTIITIAPLHDADINFNDIMRGLMQGNPEMPSEVSDYFSDHKHEFKSLNARQVEKLVSKIRSKAYKRNEPFIITMDNVNVALSEISSIRSRMASETQESDRDQRERHHEDAMKQNRELAVVGFGIGAMGLIALISPVAVPVVGAIWAYQYVCEKKDEK